MWGNCRYYTYGKFAWEYSHKHLENASYEYASIFEFWPANCVKLLYKGVIKNKNSFSILMKFTKTVLCENVEIHIKF